MQWQKKFIARKSRRGVTDWIHSEPRRCCLLHFNCGLRWLIYAGERLLVPPPPLHEHLMMNSPCIYWFSSLSIYLWLVWLLHNFSCTLSNHINNFRVLQSTESQIHHITTDDDFVILPLLMSSLIHSRVQCEQQKNCISRAHGRMNLIQYEGVRSLALKREKKHSHFSSWPIWGMTFEGTNWDFIIII
jgi:hypothetical protein